MATIQEIGKIVIDTNTNFENAASSSDYDLAGTSLKTIDLETASTSDKEKLITFYEALIGYINGTVSAENYATALNAITKYVLTADDYQKLRDSEINIKNFLADVVQKELYSTDSVKGFYIRLGETLQSAIDSLNNNVINPINNNFSNKTFFPNEIIDEDFFSEEVLNNYKNFANGTSIITANFGSAIDSSTDIGTTAEDAASTFVKKPIVIVIN